MARGKCGNTSQNHTAETLLALIAPAFFRALGYRAARKANGTSLLWFFITLALFYIWAMSQGT